MAPALLPITVQAVALSVVSSLLAQVLTAYQTQVGCTLTVLQGHLTMARG